MSTTVTLIPGDGIGPSIMEVTLRVLEAGGADLEYDRQIAGMAAVHDVDDPLPQATIDSVGRTGVILKGPLTTPVGHGFRSINVELRKRFDLFANVRPAVTLMTGGRYDAGRVEFEDRIIDATAMHMVMDPHQFDVLVMENMFGDILSDLMAGLVGGLGMAPGGNIGDDVAMFEPVHGSAPDIAGSNVANPTAQVLAACMMLEHIGEQAAAERIRTAITDCLRECGPADQTRDIGGSASTDAFADAITARLS